MNHPLTVLPVPGIGAEDVVLDEDGWVLTGTEDGSVFRVRPDGGRIDRVGGTGGRPLGLELLPDGRILVCDAARGLLALDRATGRTEVLLDSVDGRRMKFCNNAAVHSSGDVYFSDSSTVHPLERWRAEVTEDTASGRLLRLRQDGSVDLVADGLRFANGVALSADESYAAVAETGARTVVRVWLAGERAGTTDLLADDLPGYPDNLSLGSDGLVWAALASPRTRALEAVHRVPRPLRRAAGRLPPVLQPRPQRTVQAIALDDTGRVVRDVTADASRFHFATGVREHHGRLWLGSLASAAVAVAEL